MTNINQTPPSSSMQALKTRQAQFMQEMAMKKKGDAPPETKQMEEVVADIKARRMEALLGAEKESKKPLPGRAESRNGRQRRVLTLNSLNTTVDR